MTLFVLPACSRHLLPIGVAFSFCLRWCRLGLPFALLTTTPARQATASEVVEPHSGVFPFVSFARRFNIWEITPMDQGGRLVQMQLFETERDDEIARTVRQPGFFAPWGDPIQWDALEKSELEKSVWLNRWYFLPSLARQYARTGDRSYLQDLLAFVRQWRQANPLPRDLPAYLTSRQRNWRDMQVAWRVQNLAWCYFLGAAGFTPAEKHELYELIDVHAQVLLADFGTQALHENNHQSHGAGAMLYAALLFPEIHHAAAIRQRAIAILEHHLAGAFFADGNSVELCPGYYPFFVSIFRDAYLLCLANGVAPPRGSTERLSQFYDYLSTVVQPDGTMPPINDSSETGAQVAAQVLAEVLARPWPTNTCRSHLFSASHQAVLRDPTPHAPAYVFLDAGPHVAYHWHGGKLGFHLWYWDRALVVDSGVSSYDDPRRDTWYIQPQAHNTLLVDGTGDYDFRRESSANRPDAGSGIVHWETGPAYDWAVMTHTGFTQREAPVSWTRHFVLWKGVGCVIVDHLASAAPHDYEWLFHLAPGAPVVDAATGAIFTGYPEHNLLLQPAAPVRPQLVLRDGTINRRSHNLSAPVATYHRKAAECVQAFLLLPETGRRRPTIQLQQEVTDRAVTLRLVRPAGESRLTLRWPEKSSDRGGYSLQLAPAP